MTERTSKMTTLKVKCKCESIPINGPKIVYIVRRRADGGFTKSEMFFTLEAAEKSVSRWRAFYRDDVEPVQPGRTWDREHYLVKCFIIENELYD